VSRFALLSLLVLAGGLSGCDSLPGKPTEAERPVLPSKVMDFAKLYDANCAGCHGANGQLGAARALNDALYLAWAGDDELVRVTANGVPGTAMPAFAVSQGGGLTDEQITALIDEMVTRWGGKASDVDGLNLPPHEASLGDPESGAQTYATFCAACHGADGTGGTAPGSIVDGSYLALVSDQALRSIVVVGRKDLGMPDWRHLIPGRPMSDAQIADVVAWLASKRVPFPGQMGGLGQNSQEGKTDG